MRPCYYANDKVSVKRTPFHTYLTRILFASAIVKIDFNIRALSGISASPFQKGRHSANNDTEELMSRIKSILMVAIPVALCLLICSGCGKQPVPVLNVTLLDKQEDATYKVYYTY